MDTATTCQLPDGRSVTLDGSVVEQVSCGVIVLGSVTAVEQPEIWRLTKELSTQLRAEHHGRKPSQIPGLAEARTLYKSFGVDPSRTRPSSEALLRRVMSDKELYRINGLVDACNLASLSFLLPIGMYDLSRIQGGVTLKVGAPGDVYPGIRKADVNVASRLALFDDEGPFGSPTSDSARTCMTENTNEVMAVIMATASYPDEKMADHLTAFSELYCNHCGGVEWHRSALNGRTP
ncbi:MAG: DNA/RNA-binding domain of Phe-tRNA-synthetase-like protein [Candidatus Krumholzibacteriia bacterium]|jgi:DNA/RNA-binding domain of Phe-tRNA-synthetase-like protein